MRSQIGHIFSGVTRTDAPTGKIRIGSAQSPGLGIPLNNLLASFAPADIIPPVRAARGMPEGIAMSTDAQPSRIAILQLQVSKFWSDDLGLTIITMATAALVFVISPLGEAGLRARIFFDVMMVMLMISGSLTASHGRLTTVFVVFSAMVSAVVLTAGRVHPTPFLHQVGSVVATLTLLLYIYIVILVMFRGGPVTWSRIQGGISVYLLLGMAWASAYQFVEQHYPGSFQFITLPGNIDQLTSKLTYYSFGTLTTVGTDIAAVQPFARSLTMAEAVVGQLFPATFIGALVAMAMQARAKP